MLHTFAVLYSWWSKHWYLYFTNCSVLNTFAVLYSWWSKHWYLYFTNCSVLNTFAVLYSWWSKHRYLYFTNCSVLNTFAVLNSWWSMHWLPILYKLLSAEHFCCAKNCWWSMHWLPILYKLLSAEHFCCAVFLMKQALITYTLQIAQCWTLLLCCILDEASTDYLYFTNCSVLNTFAVLYSWWSKHWLPILYKLLSAEHFCCAKFLMKHALIMNTFQFAQCCTILLC